MVTMGVIMSAMRMGLGMRMIMGQEGSAHTVRYNITYDFDQQLARRRVSAATFKTLNLWKPNSFTNRP